MPASFEIPAEARFTCSRCGDCCRAPWNIALAPVEAERLRGLDWSGRAPSLVGVTPTVRPPRGPERLARRPDGACVFLGPASECLLHEHFGAGVKPHACRSYPFSFAAVGERVGVDVAWSCRAVALGEGEPVAQRAAELERLLAEAGGPPRDAGRHEITEGRRISSETLLDYERLLDGILADPAVRLLERLRRAQELVALTAHGEPEAPTAAAFRRAIATGLGRRAERIEAGLRMDATQAAVFWQWLWLCLHPAPPDFDLEPPARREQEALRRVAAATRFRDRQGAPTVMGREVARSFEDVAAVGAGALADDAAARVTPFLRAKLAGQRVLASPDGELPLAEGVARLVLLLPLTLWTAKALAAGRLASEVEGDDVTGALRLLDRTVGALSLAELPAKQREAFAFVLRDTDLVTHATEEILAG